MLERAPPCIRLEYFPLPFPSWHCVHLPTVSLVFRKTTLRQLDGRVPAMTEQTMILSHLGLRPDNDRVSGEAEV